MLFQPSTPQAEQSLGEYPPLLRRLLFNRGYATGQSARQYLNYQIPPGFEPENLKGVAEAADRILWGLKRQQPIAIYGDYDADGVTATALLVSVLEELGGMVQGYIPNRFDEGYGLNIEALKELHDAGAQLVITVDCGIRSLKEARFARELGLDLIITDHHQPLRELPEAVAVIDPKQPGETYPEHILAGVGIAYKLAQAILHNAGKLHSDPASVERTLDLVALGTVADLAPLVGENRILVSQGLRHLRNPRRQGVFSLIQASGLKTERITAEDIGYILGPRLNAAGRIETAQDALSLLTTRAVENAGFLAQKLNQQNQERQKLTREIVDQAATIALERGEDKILLFAAHPDFSSGIVGLAASRLMEGYYRPAIVAQRGEEYTRGSCRSIPEFHITAALDQCADLLEHHGGHAAAAGFTVRNKNLEELIGRLDQIAEDQLAGKELRPVLMADAEIPLDDLKPEILSYLDMLQPTGYGNPKAVFISRNVRVLRYRWVGKNETHLKLTLSGGKITHDAIAFNQDLWKDNLPAQIDLAYTFEFNEFNGRQTLQLNVLDLKPCGAPD